MSNQVALARFKAARMNPGAARTPAVQEMEARAETLFSSLAQRVEGLLTAAMSQLGAMVRSEVAAQMPPIPPPQVTHVHETPVTQVVETKHTVERVVERQDLVPVRVKRGKDGRIASIVRDGQEYVVQRDKDGLITGLRGY